MQDAAATTEILDNLCETEKGCGNATLSVTAMSQPASRKVQCPKQAVLF
jgi:hypothetical protein